MKTPLNAILQPTAPAAHQIIMEGIDYLGDDCPLVATSPLAGFGPVYAPCEATLVVPAHVSGTTGHYFAVIPTTEAMAPTHMAGQYVVFKNVEARRPVDGDVVYAWVSEREILNTTTGKDRDLVCIRRYGHDANGAETLTPIAEGFDSWTAGKDDWRETEFLIVGVATPYRPWAQGRRRADGVWVARGTMALGYFPENAVNMDGALDAL